MQQLTPSAGDSEPVRVRGDRVTRPVTALWSRPVLACATVLGIAAVTEWTPGLHALALFGEREPTSAAVVAPGVAAPVLSVGEAEIAEETGDRPDLASRAAARGAHGPIAEREDRGDLPQVDAKLPPIPLTDPQALASFYAALGRTQSRRPSAVTRVLHFGDSLVVSDFVSSTLRRRLQKQFGDAGHGFTLVANAWPSYFHNDVYRFATSGWLVSRIVGPLTADGLYGLGGVSFRALPGVRARFGTEADGDYGRQVSRFEVAYLETPGGADLELNIDGGPSTRISTNGPAKKSAFHRLDVPDGPHRLELVSRGKGYVRLFGVVMERDVPGVVLDALGVQGARIRFLDKQDDAHWAEQLRWRKPDLVVYEFGANESGDGFAYPMDEYHQTMKDVIAQARRALPDASCLVIGAMDRAHKGQGGLESMRIIPLIVKEQRAVAAEVGCAYFDTFTAMGGHGSMPSWVRRGLGQADLTHPSGLGAEILGNWIFRALMQGYNAYLNRPAAR
jgi:lysophospholipase L1-like esterase